MCSANVSPLPPVELAVTLLTMESKRFPAAAMSVKDVLQSLVDDGLVDCERIGTSNYYWAFPSKALHARTRKLEALNSQVRRALQPWRDVLRSDLPSQHRSPSVLSLKLSGRTFP